jgi:hypothetical protein
VPSISPSEKTSPSILWQRLTALKVFEGFSDKERDAFLQAYEHDPALCMRRFAPAIWSAARANMNSISVSS